MQTPWRWDDSCRGRGGYRRGDDVTNRQRRGGGGMPGGDMPTPFFIGDVPAAGTPQHTQRQSLISFACKMPAWI